MKHAANRSARNIGATCTILLESVNVAEVSDEAAFVYDTFSHTNGVYWFYSLNSVFSPHLMIFYGMLQVYAAYE